MGRLTPLRSHLFSAQLGARLLGVLGVAALAAPHASCQGSSPAGAAGATTTHGAGGATTTTTLSSGGAGGSTGDGLGAFDAGIPEGGLGPPPPGTECFDWPADAGDCPTDPGVIIFALDQFGCTDGGGGATKEASAVDSPPMHNTTGQCCYVVEYQWCVAGGRPYLSGDRALVAGAVRGRAWSDSPGHDLAHLQTPDTGALDAGERAALASAWTADALLEHASIASFSRFSLSLLAAGAPASLLEGAHRAALDEVRHARLCFALASAYAGEGVSPGRFPVATGSGVEITAGLAGLAVSAVHEGCVGETIAAVMAAEQHARASDPAVRAALAEIAADEARHAELAWRTVAWAIEAGGAEVRDAVAGAFREASSMGETPKPPPRALAARRPPCGAEAALEAHGRLDAATTARVAASAMALVVGPASRALLAHAGGDPQTPASGDHRPSTTASLEQRAS